VHQLVAPPPSRPPRGALWRSGAVGVAATLVDLAALSLLVDAAGLTPTMANVPALVLGLIVQFAGNKVLAFRDRSPDILPQGAWFLVVEAGAFALNALGYHIAVTLTPLGQVGQG
jgi:putative flippase GtrA